MNNLQFGVGPSWLLILELCRIEFWVIITSFEKTSTQMLLVYVLLVIPQGSEAYQKH
jgi:hypothetical protein